MQAQFENPKNGKSLTSLDDMHFNLNMILNKFRRYYPKTVDYVESIVPNYFDKFNREITLADLNEDDEIRLAVCVLEDLKKDCSSFLDIMIESDLADSLCFSLVHKQYWRLEADFIRICLEHLEEELKEIFEIVSEECFLPTNLD